MPSYDDAILYLNAGPVDIDEAVFTALHGEQYLLVESCVCTPEQGPPEERRRPDGKAFLTVYPPATLVWSLEARVAEWNGLADYHPGAKLSRQALAFANGPDYRIPFQFEDDGELVFERPTLTPQPGSLPTLSFGIRLVNGGGLDAVAHPAGGGGGGPAVLYADVVPMAAPVEVLSTMGHTLLVEVFENGDAFAGDPVVATFYSGDPAAGGTAVTAAAEMDAWGDIREHNDVYGGEAWSPLTEWADITTAERRATHLRLARHGLVIRDIALPVELIIPAYFAARLPAGALGVWLRWAISGGAPAVNPGMAAIEFLMGGTRADLLPDTDRILRAWDGDPSTGTELDHVDLTAGALQFNVSALTVNPGTVTGTTAAPGGGWTVAFITIETSTGLILFQQPHTAAITVGNVLTLTDEPVMDLTT